MQAKQSCQNLHKSVGIIVLLALCSFSVFAIDSFESNYWWTGFQLDEFQNGNSIVLNAHYNVSTPSEVTMGLGSDFQPMVYDINYDSKKEMVFTSGNYLYAFNQNSDTTVNQIAQYILGASQNAQMAVVDSSKGAILVISLSNGLVKSIYYNMTLSSFVEYQSYNATLGNATVVAGLACTSHTTPHSCYWTTTRHIIKYFPTNNTAKRSPIFAGSFVANNNMPIFSWDNVNYHLAVYGGEATYYVTAVKVSDLSTYRAISMGAASNPSASHMTFYNAEGTGYGQLFISGESKSCGADCTHTFYVNAYNNDGSLYNQYTIGSCYGGASQGGTSDILTGSFTNYSREICVQGQYVYGGCPSSSGSGGHNIACFEAGHPHTKVYTGKSEANGDNLIAFDADGDGWHDIVLNNRINYIKRGKNTTLTTAGGFYAVGDLKGSTFNQLVSSQATTSVIYNYQATDDLPVWNSGELGRNYANPICTGTSLSLTAYQCPYDYLACQYTNDLGDFEQERLNTDCGQGTNTTGAYAYTNPSVTCSFSTAGNFMVHVYLQQAMDSTDKTVLKTFLVQVINGTAGSTCNLIPTTTTISGTTGTETSSSSSGTSSTDDAKAQLESVFETLTFGSSWLKWFVVLGFIVLTIIFMWKFGIDNALIINGVVFLEMVMFSVLGMLNWAYVFIYLLVAVLSVVVMFVLGSKTGSGG
jgi:hypothetical protein